MVSINNIKYDLHLKNKKYCKRFVNLLCNNRIKELKNSDKTWNDLMNYIKSFNIDRNKIFIEKAKHATNIKKFLKKMSINNLKFLKTVIFNLGQIKPIKLKTLPKGPASWRFRQRIKHFDSKYKYDKMQNDCYTKMYNKHKQIIVDTDRVKCRINALHKLNDFTCRLRNATICISQHVDKPMSVYNIKNKVRDPYPNFPSKR